MRGRKLKIGVMAPASRLIPAAADKVTALLPTLFPNDTPEIVFHPQCYLSSGHFAGNDDERAKAFIELANDESFDAVWFARGGYGSNRIVERVLAKVIPVARAKTYLG